MRPEQQFARAAGRVAGRWLPKARTAATSAGAKSQAAQFAPVARRSGQFVKHVLPAVIKPMHSLWHEILGFTFLVFAAIGLWKIWRHTGPMPPVQLAIVVVFVVVMAAYGISSIRKSRRITRSYK